MSIIQISKIQNKRGDMDVDRTGLPVLAPGELGYATNRSRLFVGNVGATSPTENTEVLTQNSLGPTLNYNTATGKVDAVGGGSGGSGTTYTIESAVATPSGANLRLVGSDSTVDSVRFAGSDSITVTSTNDGLITIGGGGSNAAGPDKSIQFNSSNSFTGSSNLLFDSSATTLTVGGISGTGTLVFYGSSATIGVTTTNTNVTILPGENAALVIGSTATASILEGAAGQSLTVSSDNTLYLQSTTGDIVIALDNTTATKVSISGPSAVQYVTGLNDNDLVNKYYVDNIASSTGVTQIVAGTNISIDPLSGTGTVTINATSGGVSGPVSSTARSIATWNGAGGNALYDNPNVGVTSNGDLKVGDFFITTGAYTTAPRANIGIGVNALLVNTTGSSNVAIGCGDGPLAANTTGSYNIAIGSSAMNDNLIGSYNVAIGTNALYTNADVGGQFNTAVGHEAGVNLYSGSGNTILGAIQGPSSMNDTVLLAAGQNKQRLRINENGAWSFTNPYNAESLDYGTTGYALISNGIGAHPDWKPANTKLPSYTESANPIYFSPTVAGQVIKKSGGTIEANTGTCTADDFFMVYNTSSSTNISINQGTGFTLRQAGTTNTGNRTLAPYGFAKVWFVSSAEAVISGDGLS